MDQQKFKVSALGLGDTEYRVLQVVQDILKDEGIHCELLNSSDANGELVIIDYETELGQSLFTQVRDSQVKILFTSSHNIRGKNIVTLQKPVRVATLADVISQVCKQMYAHIIKRHKNKADTPSQTNLTASNDNSDKHIFHYLLKAKSEGLCMKLACNNQANIFVNGADKTVYIGSNSGSLVSYYPSAGAKLTSQVINSNDFQAAVQGLTPHALDAELWRSGIECSHGKILPGQSTDVPVKLKAWPNFSRQGFKPEFFKIAAYMARQPISINELSTLTQIQLDIIIDFYNAAMAVDLIQLNSQANTGQNKERKINEKKQTLLGKLAQRLRFALDKHEYESDK